MRKLVRCKACGYITVENKLKDVCPACGVPIKAFEPYSDPLSERRSRLLELYLHPITVHFPQAFATVIPFLLAAGWLPVPFNDELVVTAQVLIYLLPLTIIAGMIAGFIDGITRFKKIKTKILIKKIVISSIMLVISVIGTALAFTGGMSESIIPWLILIGVLCIVCSVLLGNFGNSIMECKLPG